MAPCRPRRHTPTTHLAALHKITAPTLLTGAATTGQTAGERADPDAYDPKTELDVLPDAHGP